MEFLPVVVIRTIQSTILLFAAFGVRAQEPDPAIKVDVDVVNVLCTVYDSRGVLVKDLKKDDFEIREEGRKQEIRYFARDTNLPLTVALLVDVSGSVRTFVDTEKLTAEKFLREVIRPNDQALLVGFSSTVILWQDLTSSAELLQASLEKLRPIPFRGIPLDGRPMPGTLLYDAVVETSTKKLNDVAGRKVMVIISDGLDNGSQLHLEDAVRSEQMTNTVVYGICYESGFSGCSFLKNMSEPTGGHVFRVGKNSSLSKIFQTIEDEVRSQYAIGYVPANRTHDGKFRKLQVRAIPRGLKVEARKGYYASH